MNIVRPPKDIQASTDRGMLAITWQDDRVVEYPFRWLRCQCACAHCVDEVTGQRILDPATVPNDISIAFMNLVGRYAVQIQWSDDHATGIYSWDRLTKLADHIPSDGSVD